MPRKKDAPVVTQQIQRLLVEREQHQNAVSAIDGTLASIRSLLNDTLGTESHDSNGRGGRVGRTAAKRDVIPDKSGRRRRGRFKMSGEEAVRQFVRSKGSPTTQEINAHWKSSGRAGTADNTITKMVKDKRLTRSPLKGQRGSRYRLA
jgi:hypothetical protein